jgi:DNA-binding beta-propeller fold protein YncE
VQSLMKKRTIQWLGIAGLVFMLTESTTVCGVTEGYRFVKEIPVGGEGGWDYVAADETARRLYVSHASKVIVIDSEKDSIIGEIADTPGIHGFAIAPELGRGYSSNGQEDKVSIVDLKTLKTLSKVETGENPDAILYEPSKQEVYAFNGRGSSATVIDAKTGEVISTISLPGKPEFATADPKASRVYCNIEDKSEVVAIDATSHRVVNTWPIAPGEEASGMAIDLAGHRLFLGCNNKMMAMMDDTNGKVITTVPIGSGVDANAFDPGTQLAFASCGDGTVTVAHEESPDKLTVVQTLPTERGARTMALDPKTHRIYLPAAKYEAVPPQAAGAPRQRPKIVPGTFKVLVYEMEKADEQ